jgi:hypothetical protein
VLVFVRTVDVVNEVVKVLKMKVDEANIQTLTGTMRGYERDRMAPESKLLARFKKHIPVEERTGTVLTQLANGVKTRDVTRTPAWSRKKPSLKMFAIRAFFSH